MIPLFDITVLDSFKSNEKLPLKCEYCGETFYNIKKEIRKVLNNHSTVKLKYCSKSCTYKSSDTRTHFNCDHCGKEILRQKRIITQNKKNFCSRSCGTTYYNTHKTKGIRRSKLEIYLEDKLKFLYPNLVMDFNQTDTINSELDIFIPSLNLAFELNGIFHYEPIFGEDKKMKTQNNDTRKFQACSEKNIELCVIDTSQQKHFKEQTSQKYLSIIKMIIDNKIGREDGTDPSSYDPQSYASP